MQPMYLNFRRKRTPNSQRIQAFGMKVNPHSRRSFVLANGEKFVRRVGSADIIYKKRRGAITVVFGEKGDFPLLGVTALEAVGLILDPVQRKLKPVALTA